MKGIHKWTGWSKKKSEVLLLFLLPQQLFGPILVTNRGKRINTELILSILLVTLTLLQKLSAHSEYLMAVLPSLMQKRVCNHKVKQCGDKQTNTKYHVFVL